MRSLVNRLTRALHNYLNTVTRGRGSVGYSESVLLRYLRTHRLKTSFETLRLPKPRLKRFRACRSISKY